MLVISYLDLPVKIDPDSDYDSIYNRYLRKRPIQRVFDIFTGKGIIVDKINSLIKKLGGECLTPGHVLMKAREKIVEVAIFGINDNDRGQIIELIEKIFPRAKVYWT